MGIDSIFSGQKKSPGAARERNRRARGGRRRLIGHGTPGCSSGPSIPLSLKRLLYRPVGYSLIFSRGASGQFRSDRAGLDEMESLDEHTQTWRRQPEP